MRKIFTFFIVLFTFAYKSQQLNADLIEMNFQTGLETEHLFKFNDKILFAGAETAVGYYNSNFELWGYDFTTQKSELIKEILPNSPYPFFSIKPHFTLFKNKVYFIVDNSSLSQIELWSTDGSTNGTQKIYALPENENFVINLTANENNLIISSTKGLYISDGTTAGSRLLFSAPSIEDGMITYQNYFVFGASNVNYVDELWVTDGTTNFQMRDLENDQPLYYFNKVDLYNVTNKLFFYGYNEANTKRGLWIFDTNLKKAKFLFPTDGVTDALQINNKLIFKGGDQQYGGRLFYTDLITEETFPLTFTNNFVTSFSNQNFLGKIGNYVYFFPHVGDRNRLWKTDGTIAGTQSTNIVVDGFAGDIIKTLPLNNQIIIENNSHDKFWLVNENDESFFLNQNQFLNGVETPGKIIFPYSNEKNGKELFQFNFANKEISLFNDGNYKSGSDPKNFALTNDNKLIFTANDYEHGNEFYTIENIGESPVLVKDFVYGSNDSTFGVSNGKLFKVGEYFYSQPNSYTGYLFRSNGKNENTQLISFANFSDIDKYSSFGNLNDQSLIITTYNSNDDRTIDVWKIDNNSTEKQLIKAIPTSANLPSTTKTITYNGFVYFVIQKPDYQFEIWKTDGTTENTQKAFDLMESNQSSLPILLQVFDGKLLVNKDQRLWAYESNSNTLTQIILTNDPWQSEVYVSKETKEIDGKLYLLSQLGYGSVYRFDNLNDVPVQLLSDNGMSYFSNFQKCGNNIFFATGYSDNKYHSLWSINNTTNVATKIIENDNSGNNNMKDLTCVKNYMYFARENSNKIWRSNGAANGTKTMNVTINNGNQFANDDEINNLFAFKEKLYLVGTTEKSGTELYGLTTDLPIFLSTTENNEINKVKLVLYPNPASDFIKLKNASNIKINTYTIYDTAGRIIFSGKFFNENQEIYISSLSKGIYIIEIRNNSGEVFSQKFIKK